MNFFFGGAIFLFGLAFGSFLNVCIYRMPRGLSVSEPRRSFCPHCRYQIAFYDNLPVLSWFLLRGRCRNCKNPISPRYWIVELLTASLFLACFYVFGMTLATPKYCIFSFLVLGLIFMDAEHKLLPDKFTLPGLVIGLLFSLLVPVSDVVSSVSPLWIRLSPSVTVLRLLSLADAMLGAAVGFSFIYVVGVLYLKARGVQGMGFGDTKLMAMVGSFLGLRLTLMTIFAASFVGSLYGLVAMLVVWIKRTQRLQHLRKMPPSQARRRAWTSARILFRFYQVPFGVFLGSMALLAVFFGEPLLRWYWGLYRHF